MPVRSAPIGGGVDEGYGRIADAFRRNFVDRGEVGAACAVFRDGRAVVDLWGGYCDVRRTRPWQADTLVTVFSVTKGMAAAAMAVAHSRGLFALDEPVSRYWPEFAQAGKAAVTVRQLLADQAGLPVIDQPLDLDLVADHEALGVVLAAQAPKWTPGTAQGYHAQTLGWYESQLLRRVDPAHRTMGQFFADEVAAPLDAEFYIGLPDDVPLERVASFVGGGRLAAALHAHQMPRSLLLAMLNPRSLTARAFTNPKIIGADPERVNRREVLRVEFPSMNGTGRVRSVAEIYGAFATGGGALGLRTETARELEAPARPAATGSYDRIFRIDSVFSMGFMKPFPMLSFGSSPRAYGHTGLGGAFGFADPDAGVGYAYGMNRGGYSLPTDPRELALRDALRSVLA